MQAEREERRKVKEAAAIAAGKPLKPYGKAVAKTTKASKTTKTKPKTKPVARKPAKPKAKKVAPTAK